MKRDLEYSQTVSMRSLDLAQQVPTKSSDARTPTLCIVDLALSKAFTLLTFVHAGKHMPVEEHRDELEAARLIIFHSAARYSLNLESLHKVMESDPVEHSAYLII
jgi:hypothetical protein